MPFIGPWEIALILIGLIVLVVIALIIIGLARLIFGGKKETVIVQQPTAVPTQKIMVRCSSCKTLNDEDATFCSNCGIKLK
jgi:uncharacterized paraquat-inducible protein A